VEKPELKQFGDFTREDFDRHLVWIGSHTADYGESWYGDTDEETFRPRTGDLPANESEGMLLVKTTFELRDGSKHPGFLTPAPDPDLGTQQPHLFVGETFFGFWGGILESGLRNARLSRNRGHSGQVAGFYRSALGEKKVQIEL
jgi:hypothetical protein